MAAKKVLMFSTALLLCLVIINLQRADANCDFQKSCTNIGIDNTGIVTAKCPGDSGSGTTSLDLSPHIGNSDGSLVDGAGFTGSCQNVGWYATPDPTIGIYLTADCKDNGGKLEFAQYDVSVHLYNYDGMLQWANC